ncbi:MAG TPA: hypothetical protein VK636_12035 [Gemmatimonadaceae bacterium]|nr:hypothetical protein [Gemmatimonadaceae bacterium]
MSTHKIALMTACLCAAAAQSLPAQLDTAHSRHSDLSVALGVAHTERLDATASPIRFGGQGVDFGAHYRRARGATLLLASLDGGTRDLVPHASTNGTAGEQLTSGVLHVAALRRLGAQAAGSGFAVGVDASASIDVTAHRYADANKSVSNFLIGALSLGPAVWWNHHLAGGGAHLELSAPLIALVDHPYSDTRIESRVNVRPVTARDFRGFTGAVVYTPAERRRIGVEYAYRFRVFGYSDIQPVHSASQALSVGIVTRFGSR